MRQRIHSLPFHRRVLPWIFIITFLAVAPALVFYTAGFRWNTKKGQVERYGTLIINSNPTGANILIDGRLRDTATPLTIKDMAAGVHELEVNLSGYHSWHKTLEVRAERVTFAHNILLWKISEPFLISSSSTLLLSAIPNSTSVLVIPADSPTRAIIMETDGTVTAAIPFPENIQETGNISWSENGRYALIEETGASSTTPWLIDTRSTKNATALPLGDYHWSKNELTGRTSTALLNILLTNGSVSRTPLTPPLVDQTATTELRVATDTGREIYIQRDTPTQGLLLPFGAWRFWQEGAQSTILQDETNWLSLNTAASPPEYHVSRGDRLTPYQGPDDRTHYLIVSATEISQWDPQKDSELLYRQSDRIIDAALHHAGQDVFIATEKNVFTLNLDPRDGRLMTPLASFDAITGFAVTNNILLVAGTKNNTSGVWALEVE